MTTNYLGFWTIFYQFYVKFLQYYCSLILYSLYEFHRQYFVRTLWSFLFDNKNNFWMDNNEWDNCDQIKPQFSWSTYNLILHSHFFPKKKIRFNMLCETSVFGSSSLRRGANFLRRFTQLLARAFGLIYFG